MDHDTTDNAAKRKGRPGRPPKPNPLSPAERSKRYRDRKKLEGIGKATSLPVAPALVQLQLQYDQERMKVMMLENQLRELKRKLTLPPVPNPLAKQVKALLSRVQQQDKIISACNAEIAGLRDALASRKKPGQQTAPDAAVDEPKKASR